MSSSSKKNCCNLLMLFLAASITFSGCQDEETGPPSLGDIIADYSLLSDANDNTGINDDITLVNAPFQDGGVYCNGIYHINFAEGSMVQTPVLDTLDRQSFTITVDFMVSEKKDQPVWVIGACARWLGFKLNENGTVSMLYNNAGNKTTIVNYSLNKWHTARITYKDGEASIYLDDLLAGSQKFAIVVCSDQDTQIGTTNYSVGTAFNGTIRNLKVYNFVAK